MHTSASQQKTVLPRKTPTQDEQRIEGRKKSVPNDWISDSLDSLTTWTQLLVRNQRERMLQDMQQRK